MHFETFEFENFLAIEKASLALGERGLVLVQGVNKDNSSATSNGAGKSSISDALSWTLWGTTARGESGDKIVNRTAGKNTRGRVAVRDDDRLYEIIRHRKHKEGKNALWVKQLEPVAEDLTKGTDKLTQQVVEQILGCNEEVYNAAIYAGQEKMPNLPAMTDKPLKLLIEEAAGITIIERAYDLARAGADVAKGQVTDAITKLGRVQSQIGILTTQIGDLELRRDTWGRSQAEKVDRLTGETRKLIADTKALDTIIAGLNETSVSARLKQTQSDLAAVVGEQAEKTRLERAAAEAKQRAAVLASRYQMASGETRTFKTELDSVEHRVGAPCRECGKSYTGADVAPARKLATDKLVEKARVAKGLKVEHETALGSATEAQEALSAFVAGMTDVSAATALVGSLSAKLREIDARKGERKRASDQARNGAEQIKTLKAEINPFASPIADAEQRLAQLREDLGRANEGLTAAQEELALKAAAVKVFGPAGVRAEILDTVTPFLNDRAAHYLGTLTDGNTTATWSTLTKTAKGELREKFCIEVSDVTGGDSFGLLSGGEKRKVRLACALALQDLVASRASKPLGLWIGDEIDDALDPAGIERLMAILDEKARERGTVLVISHSDLKDWCRETVTVTKEGGKSTVEGVLCNV